MDKRETGCPLSGRCGGCAYQGMTYEQQCRKKQETVEKFLKGIGRVQPILSMEEPYHYRNKVHAVFDRDRKGRPIAGIYQERSHRVVPVENCMIEDERCSAVIATVKELLPSFRLKVYDEDTGYGFMRHVLVRRGFATGQIMVVLVTASPMFPSGKHFVKALLKEHPDITTIVQSVNGRSTNMVLGQKEHVLYGKGYIEDILCGYIFRISARSFYQVNPAQTEKLYEKAIELAGLTGEEYVLDAYCGVGTIGMIASKHCRQVTGVELNPEAVKNAVSNRAVNKADNVHIVQGDAGDFMLRLAENGCKPDVVFMDPPRSGSTERFISSVAAAGTGRVVYISCNPETLARDLRVFGRKGYMTEAVWPVDMFPWTDSVESVTVLRRRQKKNRQYENAALSCSFM